MMHIVIWLMLAATLLPYVYARSEYRLPAYVVAVMLVIWATSVFLLSRRVRYLAIQVAQHSSYFLLYCFVILVSQSITMFITPGLDISDYIWSHGYIVIGMISYFIFPIVIGNRLFSASAAFLITVGAFSSAIGIYVAITGETHLLGFHIRQVQQSTALGFYTTSSIFFEANRFGIAAFLGLLGSLYFFWKRQYMLLASTAILLCVSGIFISWSRAVYLSVGIALPLWVLTVTRRSRKWIVVVLVSLLYISAYFIIMDVKYIEEILFGLGLSGRDVLWPAAIELIKERPLLGYGFGTTEMVGSHLLALTGRSGAVHSTPLGLAFHGGIPLAVLYFLVVWASLWRLWRSKLNGPEKALILTAVVGSFVAGIFLEYTPGGVAYGSLLYTVFLGLANAAPWLTSECPGISN